PRKNTAMMRMPMRIGARIAVGRVGAPAPVGKSADGPRAGTRIMLMRFAFLARAVRVGGGPERPHHASAGWGRGASELRRCRGPRETAPPPATAPSPRRADR